jgi:thiol-disulfide isomerase/thioredoxin
MPVEVQIISAVWCKRCLTIKPEVEALCAVAGATLTKLDMDQLAEDDDPLFGEIKSLPTIRMRKTADETWVAYTAATLDAWKTAIVATASVAPVTDDTDF